MDSINTPFRDIFTPKMDQSSLVIIFRPFVWFTFGTIHKLFGLNIFAFRIFKAITLGLFGLVVYGLYKVLSPRTTGINLLGVLLAMISPAVISSVWMISQEDVLSSMFFILTLILFIRLGIGRSSPALFAAFLLVSFITIFIKETTRAYLLVTILIYFLFLKKKSITLSRRQKIAVLSIFIFSILSSVPMFFTPQIPWMKLTMTFDHIKFLFTNGIVQLFTSYFIPGASLLLLSIFYKNPKLKTFIAIILICLAFSSPVIIPFSFFNMTLFSQGSYHVMIFNIIFILALIIKAIRADFPLKFFSSTTLSILVFVIFVTTCLPFSREDVSARSYIPILPFVSYIVADSIFNVFRGIKKNIALLVCSLVICTSLAYYLLTNIYNSASGFISHSQIEETSKKALAGMDLKDRVIFYINDVYPTMKDDILLFGKNESDLKNTAFFILEPYKKENDQLRLLEEFCLKSLDLVGKVVLLGTPDEISGQRFSFYLPKIPKMRKSAAVHILIEKAQVEEGVAGLLMGDFSWTENDTTTVFKAGEDLSPRKYWESGLIPNSMKMTYLGRTHAEELFNKMGRLKYIKSKGYLQISPFLEDIPARLISGIPLMINYRSYSSIYEVDPEGVCAPWAGGIDN